MKAETIEEIYTTALPIIESCLQKLGTTDENNATTSGRLLLELKWLRQEIQNRRLLLPQSIEHGMPTVRSVWTNSELPELESELSKLYDLLFVGRPPLKLTHFAEMIATIDEFLDVFKSQPIEPESAEAEIVKDLEQLRERTKKGGVVFPIREGVYPNLDAALKRDLGYNRHYRLTTLYGELRAALRRGFTPKRPVANTPAKTGSG